MLLQSCAERHLRQNRAAPGYAFATDNGPDGLHLIDPAPLWPQIAADIDAGATPGRIAARFHAGWAAVWADAVIGFAGSHGVGKIFLSGGAMQNRLLADMLSSRLILGGLNVCQHRELPANDGGLALGQIVVALARHQTEPKGI